jgi:membrane fusion protein (multidrug efflux system)
MKSKGTITAVLVLGTILVVGAGLALWKYASVKSAMDQPKPPEPPEAVGRAPVGTVRWRPTADLVGTVIARQWVNLSSEVAGTVETVGFETGSVVEPNQELIRLESRSQAADLAAADATVRSAEATVKVMEARKRLAESNVRRIAMAVEAKASPETDLDRARADMDQAVADIDAARATVEQYKARAEQLRADLDKRVIRAPFKARASIRNVHPGQYLAEGASVVVLQGLEDRIFLDFAVPQEYLTQAKPGFQVQAVSSQFEEPLMLTVVGVDAQINPDTRNVRIRSEVADPEGRLRPGMSVDVRVPLSAEREFMAVPTVAVRRSSSGDHVYVIEPAEPGATRAKQRFVKLGALLGDQTIVLEGLRAGEVVATVGSFKLREGALVMPEMPPPGPPGAGPKASAPGNAPSEGGR